jgi:CheY-like chemotaxis protein
MAKILIVDDELSNRQLLMAVLGSRGYQLSEASDGLTALEIARELRPDLIIFDIGMPEMDGIEFIRALRADAAVAGAKLALYTASVPDAAMTQLMELYEITCVISKPSEPQEVLRLVASSLESP